MDEYRKIRGAGERAALAFEQEKGRAAVEVSIARLGKVTSDGWPQWLASIVLRNLVRAPMISITEVVRSFLKVALHGTDKTMLSNEDLRLGKV